MSKYYKLAAQIRLIFKHIYSILTTHTVKICWNISVKIVKMASLLLFQPQKLHFFANSHVELAQRHYSAMQGQDLINSQIESLNILYQVHL